MEFSTNQQIDFKGIGKMSKLIKTDSGLIIEPNFFENEKWTFKNGGSVKFKQYENEHSFYGGGAGTGKTGLMERSIKEKLFDSELFIDVIRKVEDIIQLDNLSNDWSLSYVPLSSIGLANCPECKSEHAYLRSFPHKYLEYRDIKVLCWVCDYEQCFGQHLSFGEVKSLWSNGRDETFFSFAEKRCQLKVKVDLCTFTCTSGLPAGQLDLSSCAHCGCDIISLWFAPDELGIRCSGCGNDLHVNYDQDIKTVEQMWFNRAV